MEPILFKYTCLALLMKSNLIQLHMRIAFQYGTVRYGTVRYGTVRYGTVRYGTVRYGTVQYSTVQYSTVQYSTVQYRITLLKIQHSPWLARFVHYRNVNRCTAILTRSVPVSSS